MPELANEAKKMIDEGLMTDKSFRILSYWLNQPIILGEYQLSDTAEKLFPQISVEFSLKHVEDKIEDFECKLKCLGKSLSSI